MRSAIHSFKAQETNGFCLYILKRCLDILFTLVKSRFHPENRLRIKGDVS